MSWITIALGGALGALSRFGIGLLVSASGYAHIHLATLGVNVIGSLLIGFMFIAA
ncbi:MAG: fluoride efflux transporter CrcB, partial [Pseudomonadales bacterium]|nr:fluoride efflux transporter CrcB [Pseudomonadales bacterium]